MADKQTVSDPVLLYLIGVGMTQDESTYRGMLQVAGAGQSPKTRHFAIATLAMMLHLSQVPLQVIMTVVNHLRERTDDQLKEGLVAISNGSHLVISYGGGDSTIYAIDTMKVVAEQPKYVLSASMYFLSSVWQQADDILNGRASC